MATDNHWEDLHADLRGRMAEWSRRLAPHRAELEGRAECANCGNQVGDDGSWCSEGSREPMPYCRLCVQGGLPGALKYR